MGHDMAGVVQEVLDRIDAWPTHKRQWIFTTDVDRTLEQIVVPVLQDRAVRVWAKHAGHHARSPEVSPFVQVIAPLTRQFTIELLGASDRPKLVRAYPGEYIPPLPWQISAEDGLGGYDASLVFWQAHAYVLSRPGLIMPGTTTKRSPNWFQD